MQGQSAQRQYPVKVTDLDTCYSADYMRQTQEQQHFTIFRVAADRHELMIPQCITQPSTGWPLTWKTWKSQGIPKWSGKTLKSDTRLPVTRISYQLNQFDKCKYLVWVISDWVWASVLCLKWQRQSVVIYKKWNSRCSFESSSLLWSRKQFKEVLWSTKLHAQYHASISH